eukprot:gene25079-biopygen20947
MPIAKPATCNVAKLAGPRHSQPERFFWPTENRHPTVVPASLRRFGHAIGLGKPRIFQANRGSGAGVARAWRGRDAGYRQFLAWGGAGVARAWRGRGAGMSCDPRGATGILFVGIGKEKLPKILKVHFLFSPRARAPRGPLAGVFVEDKVEFGLLAPVRRGRPEMDSQIGALVHFEIRMYQMCCRQMGRE